MSQVPMHQDANTLLAALLLLPQFSTSTLQEALKETPVVDFDGRLPSEEELAGYERYSIAVPPPPAIDRSGFEVWGLDPATASALLLGLGILLAYVKDDGNGKQSRSGGGEPPSVDIGGSGPQELCKHIVDGEECGHPFQTPTTIRKGSSITVVRYCTREPDPHPTVEYFTQDS